MALRAVSAAPVKFVTFDLVYLDGVDLTRRRLVERKEALEGLGLVGPARVVNR